MTSATQVHRQATAFEDFSMLKIAVMCSIVIH